MDQPSDLESCILNEVTKAMFISTNEGHASTIQSLSNWRVHKYAKNNSFKENKDKFVHHKLDDENKFEMLWNVEFECK